MIKNVKTFSEGRISMDLVSSSNFGTNVTLKLEVDYFAECIENNHKPFNDGEAGLKVVKMLEAADKSLKNDYKKIRL